jgi:carbamate kinase
MSRRGGARKRIVVGFGGNALVRAGEHGTQKEQIGHAERLARSLAPILRRGHDLLLVHGNGPQVGNLLVQIEEAVTKVPPVSLDVCVAQTEGSIGYFLERALRNRMTAEEIDREVVCLLTHVVVDSHDAAMRHPSKPIGPYYTAYRAGWLKRVRKWSIVEDSGRGWRKVVPSPRPRKILNIPIIRRVLDDHHVVIAAGGGGVPVVEDAAGMLKGIEAVVDKDLTAAMLGRDLQADLLVSLTQVDQVFLNFGRKTQKPIARMTVKEAERFLRRGQFPPGSMGPKVEASIEFSRSTGRDAIITSQRQCAAAIAGRAGTRITA